MNPLAVLLVAGVVSAPVLSPTPDEAAKDVALRFVTAFLGLDEKGTAERTVAPFFDGEAVLGEKELARLVSGRWDTLDVKEKYRPIVANYFLTLWKPAVVRVETYETFRKDRAVEPLLPLTNRVVSASDRVVWVTLGQETEPRAVFVRFTDGKPAVAGMTAIPSPYQALRLDRGERRGVSPP